MELKSWLIDKSAIVRLPESSNRTFWLERIENGLVHISTITRLEVGYSARSAQDLEDTFATPPFSMMPIQGLTPAIEELAWQTLRQLAKKGHHRAPSIPDLLVAATAQLMGMVVLHNDKDFDLIAKITGQEVEKLKLPR
jgi:predicted nucleic acid-binding protein